jgi:acyl-CoA thioester hydrolase
VKIRVYYEDTDAGGIVYHTNYIKYCERFRSELFFSNDMMPSVHDKSGFVVRNINANFLATSKLGDMLTVSAKILKIRNTSLLLLQEIHKDEIKVFSMEILLVFVDEKGPSKIPVEFKELFQDF